MVKGKYHGNINEIHNIFNVHISDLICCILFMIAFILSYILGIMVGWISLLLADFIITYAFLLSIIPFINSFVIASITNNST